MNFDEAYQAFTEAKQTLRQADRYSDEMAELLSTRLENCKSWNLKRLKRKLQDFNAHTGEWKTRSLP